MGLGQQYCDLAALGVIDDPLRLAQMSAEAQAHVLDFKLLGNVVVAALDDGSFFLALVGTRNFAHAQDVGQLMTAYRNLVVGG